MFKILFVSILLATTLVKADVVDNSGDVAFPIMGGVTDTGLLTATPGFSEAHKEVLDKHPELANATVTAVSTQVVAGTNFYITYETDTAKYNVVVWQKVWENFIQITSFTITPK